MKTWFRRLRTSAQLHQAECSHPLAEIAAWEHQSMSVISTLDEVELMFLVQKFPCLP
jgi:hypothetical protein